MATLERTLADRLSTMGPTNPATLATRENLGDWLGEAGRIDEAVAMYEELVAECGRVLRPNHPGRRGEALAAYLKLLADQEQSLGADHKATVATREAIDEMGGDHQEAALPELGVDDVPPANDTRPHLGIPA